MMGALLECVSCAWQNVTSGLWKTGNRKKAMIMKSRTTALILSILVGGLGVDRFYLGYTGMGILKLLTGGCFGILWIIDIVNIATGRLLPADGNGYDEDIAATSAPAQSASTVLEDLEKITKLHEQKVLTDEEFEKLRADLLRKI